MDVSGGGGILAVGALLGAALCISYTYYTQKRDVQTPLN